MNFQSQKERLTADVEQRLSRLSRGEIPDEHRVAANRVTGMRSISIAMYNISDGEYGTACNWFETASSRLLTAITIAREQETVFEHDPQYCQEALHTALRSGREELITDVVEVVEEVPSEYLSEYPRKEPRYTYALSCAGVVGEWDDVGSHLDKFESIMADCTRHRNQFYVERASDALHGIHSEDAELVSEAVEHMAANDRSVETSTPASALAEAAIRRGMDISIESDLVQILTKPVGETNA